MFLTKDRVEKVVSKLISSTVKYEVEHDETNGRPDLRTSSLPYCPILDLESRFAYQSDSYAFDFYVNIGTTVHENLQKTAPRIPKYGRGVFGRWKLPNGDVHGPCFYRQVPKKFKKQVEYVELDFLYKDTLTGHLDMLYRAKKTWIAFEFKTSGHWLVETGRYLPYAKHHIQIQTYCYLLWKQYKIRVKFYTLIYLSRDKPGSFRPFVYEFTDKMMEAAEKRLSRDVVSYKLANKFNETFKLKTWQKIWDRRPCKSKPEYLKDMKLAFFGDEQCPHAKSGRCFVHKTKKADVAKQQSFFKRMFKFLKKNLQATE